MALATHPGCQLSFENQFWAAGYSNPTGTPLLEPLHRAFATTGLPWHPSAFRSHSDGNLFHQTGSTTVICGPGHLEVAHTRGEHVSLQETLQAARLYTSMIYEACVR
jgi:acetylornithine deacetylase